MELSKKILVVDDEPLALSALERLLKNEGYSVKLAHDGQEALKVCPKYNPDIVILDLMMAGINGEEVCREIRKNSSDTKIIYFSAKQFINSRASFAEPSCHPDAFITKPASSKIILSTVHRILNEQ
jgi:DNA-binding response OmpR family regulator